jgi:hypothetical protein
LWGPTSGTEAKTVWLLLRAVRDLVVSCGVSVSEAELLIIDRVRSGHFTGFRFEGRLIAPGSWGTTEPLLGFFVPVNFDDSTVKYVRTEPMLDGLPPDIAREAPEAPPPAPAPMSMPSTLTPSTSPTPTPPEPAPAVPQHWTAEILEKHPDLRELRKADAWVPLAVEAMPQRDGETKTNYRGRLKELSKAAEQNNGEGFSHRSIERVV